MSNYYNVDKVESALIGLHAIYSSLTDLIILPNLPRAPHRRGQRRQ
jgi:hypothetical protein